jgi:hypothetical protein
MQLVIRWSGGGHPLCHHFPGDRLGGRGHHRAGRSSAAGSSQAKIGHEVWPVKPKHLSHQ